MFLLKLFIFICRFSAKVTSAYFAHKKTLDKFKKNKHMLSQEEKVFDQIKVSS